MPGFNLTVRELARLYVAEYRLPPENIQELVEEIILALSNERPKDVTILVNKYPLRDWWNAHQTDAVREAFEMSTDKGTHSKDISYETLCFIIRYWNRDRYQEAVDCVQALCCVRAEDAESFVNAQQQK